MPRPSMSGQCGLCRLRLLVSPFPSVVSLPRERRNRLRVLWADLTPSVSSASLRFVGIAYLSRWTGTRRASQVPEASLHAYRALRGPRQTLWNLACDSDSIV
jgi:hypothetical protein